MASVYLHPFLFSLFILLSQTSYSLLELVQEVPSSILLPVSKNAPSGQYLTLVQHGSPPTPAHLVVDLSGPALWTDCRHAPLTCRSIQCSAATSFSCPAADSTTAPPSPCTLPLHNPFTRKSAAGHLVEEALTLSVDDSSQRHTVDRFLMSCAQDILLEGLPGGARGVFGLGRSRIGAPEQISHSFGYSQKFSLCLSPSNKGMIFSGQGLEFESSKSLIYTPLLPGDEYSYSITLKAIQIHNKKLSLGLSHSTTVKLSTTTQYSTMESHIYRVFVKAFTMAAESQGLISVPPTGPFGACFESGSSVSVPVIDLVLQSELVKWRIHGHNSMVNVSDGVMCLGFLDGGENLGASIVLGGHQLEDNLLEFDLGSSMLGFSSKKTSCEKLTSEAMKKNLQEM